VRQLRGGLSIVIVVLAACSSKSSTHSRDTDGGEKGGGGTAGSAAAAGTGGRGASAGTVGSGASVGASGAGGSSGGVGGNAGSSGGGSGGSGNAPADAAAGTGGAIDAGSCAVKAGGPMVRVTGSSGSFCIDSHEVTRAEYREFLDAKGTDTSGQDSACSWNTTFVPPTDWPGVGRDNHPVGYVDFCDAVAYCKWAGKRLCGRIGGAANAFGDFADATRSQWFAACSGGGVNSFAYGNTYDAAKCVGSDYDGISGYQPVTDVSRPAGTPSCEGGYSGIYDLSGNVSEWEDSCDAATGRNDSCRVRGGSFRGLDPTADLRCGAGGSGSVAARSAVGNWTGFRCCGP
jgi:formylglycine-generating enzyme required for sulfatase activity